MRIGRRKIRAYSPVVSHCEGRGLVSSLLLSSVPDIDVSGEEYQESEDRTRTPSASTVTSPRQADVPQILYVDQSSRGFAATQSSDWTTIFDPSKPVRSGDSLPPMELRSSEQVLSLDAPLGFEIASPGLDGAFSFASAAFTGGSERGPRTLPQGTRPMPQAQPDGKDLGGVVNSEGAPSIRPMTLSPISASDLPGQLSWSFEGFSGSGGPTNPPQKPILHGSGGSYAGSEEVVLGQRGAYRMNKNIYVGTSIKIAASYESWWSTTSWEGGSSIWSYMSTSDVGLATSNNAKSAMPYGPPIPLLYTYEFIVDANPRSYEIKFTASDSNGNSQISTLTFTSIRPNVSLTPTKGGITAVVTNTEVILKYDEPPLYIDATTNMDPAGMGTSTYMFLQLVTPSRSVTTFPGNQVLNAKDPYNNNSTPWHLDDGRDIESIAYPSVVTDSMGEPIPDPMNPELALIAYSWQPARDNELHILSDMPGIHPSKSEVKKVHINNETFKTYLMFKPQGSVWIGLEYVEWSWTALAQRTLDNTGWIPPTHNAGDPTNSTPVPGGPAFPTWSGRTSQIVYN
jgi:hypothetical protein